METVGTGSVCTVPTCRYYLRVADPVHFRPDQDPTNQNFEKRIRILLALAKNKFKHPIFVIGINQISSDFFMLNFFT